MGHFYMGKDGFYEMKPDGTFERLNTSAYTDYSSQKRGRIRRALAYIGGGVLFAAALYGVYMFLGIACVALNGIEACR